MADIACGAGHEIACAILVKKRGIQGQKVGKILIPQPALHFPGRSHQAMAPDKTKKAHEKTKNGNFDGIGKKDCCIAVSRRKPIDCELGQAGNKKLHGIHDEQTEKSQKKDQGIFSEKGNEKTIGPHGIFSIVGGLQFAYCTGYRIFVLFTGITYIVRDQKEKGRNTPDPFPTGEDFHDDKDSMTKEKNISLEELLYCIQTDEEGKAVHLLSKIVSWLRPSEKEKAEVVGERVRMLRKTLEANPESHKILSQTLRGWLENANYFLAFAVLGIFSRQGFLREFDTRIYEHLNPEPINLESLSGAISFVFNKKSDPDWVMEVPGETWLKLFRTLWDFDNINEWELLRRAILEILYALEMLGIWVAGEELEPDLVRLEPKNNTEQSAFVALQRELSRYCRQYLQWLAGEKEHFEDDAHVRVLLDQSITEVYNYRKKSITKGTSIALAYLLERMEQTLGRIEVLLNLANPERPDIVMETATRFFKELVGTSAQRKSLGALIQQNIRLLSRSITENTSDHGGHYITQNRSEYAAMFTSGVGGGFIIAFMALIKIQILSLPLSPFWMTVLVSLNYSFGFMLIHVLHFTVATKQPAMTAARFAQAVQKGEHGAAKPEELAGLLIQVSRSQFIAIIGNVSVAIVFALFIGLGFQYFSGNPILNEGQYTHCLHDLHPLSSLAILHAAIAGIWLFFSGLASGFFDNRAACLGLSDRLFVHPVLKKILPAETRKRFSLYMQKNYGALWGNFIFGILLGSTAYIGGWFGLPLDIRHVAFSSANFGYAVSVNLPLFQEFCLYFFYIFLIGFFNLWVSFGLALYVAIRSRNTHIKSFPKLVSALWTQIKAAPLALFFPPKDSPATDEPENK